MKDRLGNNLTGDIYGRLILSPKRGVCRLEAPAAATPVQPGQKKRRNFLKLRPCLANWCRRRDLLKTSMIPHLPGYSGPASWLKRDISWSLGGILETNSKNALGTPSPRACYCFRGASPLMHISVKSGKGLFSIPQAIPHPGFCA